ncbi:MAG: metallophosphoesterase [Gaiellaceae bacterium]
MRRRTSTGCLARRAGSALGTAASLGLGWGWFEAGWVRLRELELAVPGLPPALDGLRVAHLSDFHLGVPSRGVLAVEKAVDWVAERGPDLTVITGDLLTHPRGESRLRALVGRLPGPTYAVLGNHDLAISRDPQARRSDLRELAPARLLCDEGELVELRGRSVWIAGAGPRLIVHGAERFDPNALSRPADLRILLCHYPRVLDALEPDRFELVLAGHMHAGQITLPYPGGRIRLAHLGARFAEGVYRSPAAVMHVSPGLGTTFVPFRLGARPEATELVLRSPA